MSITINCPSCSKKLTAPDSAAGKRARCPACQTVVTLPAAAAPEQEEVLDAEEVAPPPPLPATDDFADMGDIPLAPDATPPSMTQQEARRPCPLCGEMIPVNAVQCRFCKEIFDPTLKKAQAKKISAAAGDADLTTGEWVIAILCSGIGCICGIVWMIQGKPKGKKMFFVSLGMAGIWTLIRMFAEGASGRR